MKYGAKIQINTEVDEFHFKTSPKDDISPTYIIVF